MKKACISKGWYFQQEGCQPQKTDLPHDYAISRPRSKDAPGNGRNGYFVGGIGHYTKFLEISAEHAIVDLDGAYMCAEIRFNENLLAIHPHGYTPFLVDLTGGIFRGGHNKLHITTNDHQPSTRWYSGAGLYRDVFLWTGGKVRIEPRDLFVHTVFANEEMAQVSVEAVITSDLEQEIEFTVRLAAEDGGQIPAQSRRLHVSAGGKQSVSLLFEVSHPLLWDTEHPNLYRLDTRITSGGQELDTSELTFGIRTFTISAETGLRLNGRPLKLRGGCIHHDHGVLGAAAFPAAEARKVQLLKAAGFNALRIAHNPPSLALLEVCDREGILVMDEAFDMWNEQETAQDYHLWFSDWWARDISYMVLRDRNHPSVFSYSIGNEIPERDGRSRGAEWSEKLAAEIRRYDGTRPVTCAVCAIWDRIPLSEYDSELNRQILLEPEDYARNLPDAKYRSLDDGGFAERTEVYLKPLDIVGYNYLFNRYVSDHQRYPERVFWGSETHVLTFYQSWRKTMAHPYVLGDFTWTAFDNLGEAGTGRFCWGRDGRITGISIAEYPYRACYQGDLDLCGYRRPQSYFRAAIWQPDRELKIFTTHPKHNGEEFSGTGWHWYDVLDSWTFPEEYEGTPVQAEVYSTADEIVFLLNGNEVARAVPDEAIARTEIPYRRGTLRARAFRGGKCVAEAELHTVGRPAAVLITPESRTFRADRRDLCYFRITVADENGDRVPDAANELLCTVENGELMGIFSEDPCNGDAYGSPVCHACHGRALAIVRASVPGEVRVCVGSRGLLSDHAAVQAQ